jgi:SAM-dependent methyltransferase
VSEFDRFAGQYEDLLKDPVRDYFAPGSAFFVTRKLEVLLAFATASGRDLSQSTWADIGCGKGELLRAGRSHFANVTGCDISTDMIRDCHDVNVVLQVEDDRLPFEDASADWVTAVCVYHHIDPRQRVALTADIRRVLRPGGIFAMIEHNPLNPVVQFVIRRTPVDEHAVLLTAGGARRVMREAGLEAVATRYFLCIPERWYPRLRAVETALQRAPIGGQYCVFGVKPNGQDKRRASR